MNQLTYQKIHIINELSELKSGKTQFVQHTNTQVKQLQVAALIYNERTSKQVGLPQSQSLPL